MPNNIKVALVVIIPICTVGIITNSKNIKAQLSFISDDYYSPIIKSSFPTLDSTDDESNKGRDCFTARADTVSPSLYHNLPKPYINLGE